MFLKKFVLTRNGKMSKTRRTIGYYCRFCWLKPELITIECNSVMFSHQSPSLLIGETDSFSPIDHLQYALIFCCSARNRPKCLFCCIARSRSECFRRTILHYGHDILKSAWAFTNGSNEISESRNGKKSDTRVETEYTGRELRICVSKISRIPGRCPIFEYNLSK